MTAYPSILPLPSLQHRNSAVKAPRRIAGDRKVSGLSLRGKKEAKGERTEFPAPNFFSVPMTAPLLWAALRAAFPRTTVSRAAPPPRVLLPILVTVSQSSDIFAVLGCVDSFCEYVFRYARVGGGKKSKVWLWRERLLYWW